MVGRMKKITIYPDNPYDIAFLPKEWAQHEYQQGRGSLSDLLDTATRFNLADMINRDSHVDRIVAQALNFLLGVSTEVQFAEPEGKV